MSSEKLNKKEVIKVIRYEVKPVSDLCLTFVNINSKELQVLKLQYRENMSELEIAEKMQLSRTTIQNYKRKALEKCAKAWQGMKLIKEILND